MTSDDDATERLRPPFNESSREQTIAKLRQDLFDGLIYRLENVARDQPGFLEFRRTADAYVVQSPKGRVLDAWVEEARSREDSRLLHATTWRQADRDDHQARTQFVVTYRWKAGDRLALTVNVSGPGVRQHQDFDEVRDCVAHIVTAFLRLDK